MYIEYNTFTAKNIMQAFANGCGGRSAGNSFAVPEKFGEGRLLSYSFSSGVSALISEMRMKEDILVKTSQHSNLQNFSLLFYEQLEKAEEKDTSSVAEEAPELNRNLVRLSSSLVSVQNTFKALRKMRNVVIVFNKATLLNFLDYETTERFMNTFFSFYLKKNYTVPLDAEYRLILQELHREVNEHPLTNIFVENRISLLLEKFLYNFLIRDKHSGKRLQFKEEEISRLVKAENILLEDFRKTPPTINLLAKNCAMSPTKFKNDFKALYGLPVYEYYQKNRMAYARALIQENEYAIKEVGIMVGYSNLGHFAAAFKKEFGMLPSEWMHANRLHHTNPKDQKPNFEGL